MGHRPPEHASSGESIGGNSRPQYNAGMKQCSERCVVAGEGYRGVLAKRPEVGFSLEVSKSARGRLWGERNAGTGPWVMGRTRRRISGKNRGGAEIENARRRRESPDFREVGN